HEWPPAEAQLMANGSILIVDDDPQFCEAIAAALSVNGYQGRVAHDGEQALASIEAECPAMILLNLRMPVLDGEGLLRELSERRIRLPTILLTQEDGEDTARRFGLAAYLKKGSAVPRLQA